MVRLTGQGELRFVPGGTGGPSVVGDLTGMIMSMNQCSLMWMPLLYAGS